MKFDKGQRIDLAVIATAALLFAAGLIMDSMGTGSIWVYAAAYLIAGFRVIRKAGAGIRNLQFLDENFLMLAASLAAFYCGERPEAVAVMLFYDIGEFFEDYAVNNSRRSIRAMLEIVPQTATRLFADGGRESVPPEKLAVGDTVAIAAGERIPIDGTVLEGSSSIDTSALTGESLPRDIGPGGEVVSGTLNMNGLLKVRVDKAFENSTVSRVLELVENAAGRKAPVERFITRFARYYTPIVVGIAVLIAVLPPLLTGAPFRSWLYRAAKMLVISCPCALVLSIPLSLFAGIGSASKRGILVKGSNFIETLANTGTVCFDKTGTLTYGRFTVSEIRPAPGVTEEELLDVAACGESLSTHPIAVSISERFAETGSSVNPGRLSDYREIPGRGISAKLDGSEIFCGNLRLMHDLGLPAEEPTTPGSVVYVARNGKYIGCVLVNDTLRRNSAATIAELRSCGVGRIYMLTGDRRETADKAASGIGLTGAKSELLPGDKVSAVEELLAAEKASGRKHKALAYVGDGINDAPVLARADVGIAMGAYGSDAAVEAADVVIMDDDIGRLPVMISIARKTMTICRQNIIFALVVKFACLALSPFPWLPMAAAIFADVGVSVIAVLNSMRALKL